MLVTNRPALTSLGPVVASGRQGQRLTARNEMLDERIRIDDANRRKRIGLRDGVDKSVEFKKDRT